MIAFRVLAFLLGAGAFTIASAVIIDIKKHGYSLDELADEGGATVVGLRFVGIAMMMFSLTYHGFIK